MRLQQLNLNLLVPLEVLLRTRNVTRAAAELHMSQSAMSTALARLRTALDDPLLVRSGRELTLSPYAESLQGPLEETLARVEQILIDRPTFDPLTAQRSFTIVASDYSTLIILRPMLQSLRREAPGVRVNIQPLRDDYTERVVRDEVDILIISEQLLAAGLTDHPTLPLYEDRFVLCGWLGAGALTGQVSKEDFEAMPYVQYSTGERLNLADDALDRAGIVLQVEVRTESQLLIPYLLRGTGLVSLVPRRLVTLAERAAELTYTEPPVEIPHIRDTAVWHLRRTNDPAHEWLVSRLAAAAGRVA
ncbi:transcriptional regulator NodD1 [Intrasporangium mesophilum]